MISSSSDPAARSPALVAAYAHCMQLVRAYDRDHFLSILFAPHHLRQHLFALHAFSLDVARVREVVKDPLPGEVRLAWWREVIEGQGRGAVDGHPIAAALLDTVERFALPKAALVNLIDARIFDLYDDPMPSLDDLEGYAGETASALVQLSSLILMPDGADRVAELSGHTGVAIALTGLMRAFPIHAARGQCYLPLDLLQRHDLSRDKVTGGASSCDGLFAALTELREIAAKHALAAQTDLEGASPDVRRHIGVAVLPLALVPGDLKALARVGNPFRDLAGASPVIRQFHLWRAAQRLGAGRAMKLRL
ncbi:phytoene/squalene synthase family protein [Xanthobacter sp. TB0139]|uniref:phytoene/squalene synthase family protein n=1 Tax=Xanthobacter sp. TB0139 TaxID=3459178 RepID=UPI004039FB98